MHRLTIAVAAAMLALPASAIAAPTRGVVLSVDAGHHTVRVVNAKHLVHAYRYRGRTPKLRPGSRISFAHSGRTISHVRVASAAARSLAFYGRVVRFNGRGLVLRLGDGGTVSFSSRQVSHVSKRVGTHWHRWRALRSGTARASTAAVRTSTAAARASTGGPRASTGVLRASTGRQTLTLAPGTVVLVTETLSRGHVTIALTLPTGATGSRPGSTTNSGGDSSGADAGGDIVGTITQLSSTAVTISTSGRSMTFTCDPADDLTDGFAVGDLVDVTYDSTNGSPTASDIEYVESDVTGTVTAADTASLTLNNSDTGQAETIVADPAEDMFDGVNVNDVVVVTYHQSAGQLIADVVDDETAGN